MPTNLSNLMGVGLATVPYVEAAWVTSLSAALQQAPANTVTVCLLNTKIIDTRNIATLSNNLLTIPSGRYAYEVNANVGSAANYNTMLIGLTASNQARPLVGFRSSTAMGSYVSMFNLNGQFELATTASVGVAVATAVGEIGHVGIQSYYGPGLAIEGAGRFSTTYFSPIGSQDGTNQRTTLKLWKFN